MLGCVAGVLAAKGAGPVLVELSVMEQRYRALCLPGVPVTHGHGGDSQPAVTGVKP